MEILRRSLQKAAESIAGKAGFMPFRISLGYNTEKGTLKTSKYERYTGAVNLSPKSSTASLAFFLFSA